MSIILRLLIAFAVAPAVPAIILLGAALPSPNVVWPIAKTLLVYGYLASLLVALPAFFFWRRRLASKPTLVVPIAGAIGTLVASTPFLVVMVRSDVRSVDWTSLLALVPLSALGATFGVLSGVAFLLICGSSLSRMGVEPK